MIKLPTFVKSEKKPGGGSRKDFVRTKISRGENVVSVIILLLIVGTGIGVYLEGNHFDPDLYVVRSGSLDSTAAPVVGKSQTIEASPAAPAPNQSAAPAQGSSDMAESDSPTAGGNSAPAAAPAPVPNVPMDIPLPGIKPMSDTEFYTADTLYEKIDGRSPAYQAFNVQGLRCRTFSVLAASGSYVDVYEYRFDTPLDAFGMFSSERDPQGKPLDFAPDGYFSGMGYFFRQGPVYVQISGSDQNPATLAAALALAKNRAKALPVDDTGVAARRQLPAAGLVADSVAFVLEDAQGQSALKNVFQAKYNFSGTTLSFFIMVASESEASQAWNTFQKFCSSFGKVELLPDVNGAKIFRTQLFGKWKVVFLRGKELGGTFDATDPVKAQAFVEQYLKTQPAIAPSAAPSPASTTSATPAAGSSDSAESDSPNAGGNSTPAAAPAPAALPNVPMEIALPGIKPMSDTEFYTADTLYEKIDGRSPAYQAFNVQGLRCRTFSVLAVPGSYVDVYEYRFDTPLDAFGMFSSERDPQGKPLDFAPDGYFSGMGYFFRQGPVYVQISGSDQNPATLAAALALAKNRAKALPVDDTGVAARRQLPAAGLVADSVAFVLENAQGQKAL
jgi:hypothetical protein